MSEFTNETLDFVNREGLGELWDRAKKKFFVKTDTITAQTSGNVDQHLVDLSTLTSAEFANITALAGILNGSGAQNGVFRRATNEGTNLWKLDNNSYVINATMTSANGIVFNRINPDGTSESSGSPSIPMSTIKSSIGLQSAAYKIAENTAGNVPVIGNDGKLPTTIFPDAIVGQLLFGGTVSLTKSGDVVTATASVSPNAQARAGVGATVVLTNDDTSGTGWVTFSSIYFLIGSLPAGVTALEWAGMRFEVGDWLVSIGTAWKKIDNTDAVTGIKFLKNGTESSPEIGSVIVRCSKIGALDLYETNNQTMAGKLTIGSSTSPKDMEAYGGVSAHGITDLVQGGGGGGASGVNIMRNWSDYDATDESQVLGTNLAKAMKDNVTSKGSATNPVYFDANGVAQTITSYGGNSATATKLATARGITIGSKSNNFDGSADISFTLAEIGAQASLPTSGSASSTYAINISGNAATATQVGNAITINGTSYNGSEAKSFSLATQSDFETGMDSLTIGLATVDGKVDSVKDDVDLLKGKFVPAGNSSTPIYINTDGTPTIISSLAVTRGGTGLSTIASGKMLYASANDTLAALDTTAYGRGLLNKSNLSGIIGTSDFGSATNGIWWDASDNTFKPTTTSVSGGTAKRMAYFSANNTISDTTALTVESDHIATDRGITVSAGNIAVMTGGVSANGITDLTQGGGGGSVAVNIMRSWSDYDASDESQVTGSNITKALKDGITSKGNSTTPVYFNGNGEAVAISSYSGKSATAGTADKVGHSITIQKNGTTIDSFDGSSAKTINISDVASASGLSTEITNRQGVDLTNITVGAMKTRSSNPTTPALRFSHTSGQIDIARGTNVDISATNLYGEALPQTNQQFWNRTTAGDANITPTGSAHINKIMGETVRWNQLVYLQSLGANNIVFSNGICTYNNGVIVFKHKNYGVGGSWIGFSAPNAVLCASHRYYARIDIKINKTVTNLYGFGLKICDRVTNFNTTTINSWISYELCASLSSGSIGTTTNSIWIILATTYDTDLEISIKNYQVHDLTAEYGTDAQILSALGLSTWNDTDVIAAWKRLHPLPYYAYNAGELVSVGGEQDDINEGTWSITIDESNSNPQQAAMQGDIQAWKEFRSGIGRYLLKPDGTARKLMPNDSSKYTDGTTIDETQGDVMVRIPKFYYKGSKSGNITKLTMSVFPYAGFCEMKEQWVGAYMGSVTDSKLRSRSGVNPTRSKTISQFWTAAQAINTNYGLSDYNQRKAMIMIYLCEYLNLNSQAMLGNGMTGDGNNWCSVVQNATTGATKTLGDTCGNVAFTTSGQTANNACHTSLFGIEDTYGWFFEMIQGCYFGSSANTPAQTGTEAFLYEGNRMPSSEELADKPSGAYRQLVRPTSGGYLKTILAGEYFDILPATLGGSSSSYWCDYHYANDTGQLLLWGGNASLGSYVGLAYSDSYYAFSNAYSNVAARLAYYGNVTIEGETKKRKYPSLETIGYNAFKLSTNQAKLAIGNYKIEGTYTSLSYHAIDGTIEPIVPSSGLFTTTKTGILTVVGGNSTTCVHLVHSGNRTGYEPHESHSLNIQPYVPEVFTKKKYALGELCLHQEQGGGYAMYKRTANGGVKRDWNAGDWTMIRCAGGGVGQLLSAGSVCDYVESGEFTDANGNACNTHMSVAIGSRAYQSGDESNSNYKTDGTYTYYPLDSAIDLYYNSNMDYWVDDYGTESIAPAPTSHPVMLPPKMNVTYGINAVDDIRHLAGTYLKKDNFNVMADEHSNMELYQSPTQDELVGMKVKIGDKEVDLVALTNTEIQEICS